MSQENVEIVKANIDAYNREDWDAFLKDAAPGFEVDLSRAVGPWRGVFGLDQILRVLGEFRETWESARPEAHEFIEAGDLVVMHSTLHLKGRGGIEVVARAAFVWTIRNGAIERVTMYQERQGCARSPGAVGARRSRRLLSFDSLVRTSQGSGHRAEQESAFSPFSPKGLVSSRFGW